MMTAAEAGHSDGPQENQENSRKFPGGGSEKDPDHGRLCGLFYLVVDDSRFARATVKNVLHAVGIRNVTECETAEQAINLLKSNGIDVIITDFEMPGMNGAEFVWRLRRSKDERIQRIPAIMVSDHADEGRVRTAVNSGVNEFLPKPFSQNDLYSRLRRSVISPKPFIVAPGYIGPDRRIVDNGSDNGAERRSDVSPPALLYDFTGPEPKRIEIAKPGMAAAAKAEPASAMAEPTPKPKPSFSALSESDLSGKDADGGLAAALKERIESERGTK